MITTELRNFLESSQKSFKAFIGLDGFIDEIVYVVSKRNSDGTFERVPTLKEYGNKIAAASGLSTNVEIETILKKLGGNGPIFALGLKEYGTKITYIGNLGESAPDPVFEELCNGSEVITLADPGRTDAMEFDDGKLIRGKLSSLNKITWERIIEKVSISDFAKLMDQADLVAFNNWTMIPKMNDIWSNIIEKAIPEMTTDLSEKTMFFDLADPEKRSDEDILVALGLISKFKTSGFNTVLGINLKEACEIASVIGNEKYEDYKAVDPEMLCKKIADFMKIDCLIVHPVERAVCMNKGELFSVDGPYTAKPVLTTGAGDNFNSGFVFGYVNGLSMKDCLLLGVASSGFYVRNGRSAKVSEVLTFIEKWDAGLED